MASHAKQLVMCRGTVQHKAEFGQYGRRGDDQGSPIGIPKGGALLGGPSRLGLGLLAILIPYLGEPAAGTTSPESAASLPTDSVELVEKVIVLTAVQQTSEFGVTALQESQAPRRRSLGVHESTEFQFICWFKTASVPIQSADLEPSAAAPSAYAEHGPKYAGEQYNVERNVSRHGWRGYSSCLPSYASGSTTLYRSV